MWGGEIWWRHPHIWLFITGTWDTLIATLHRPATTDTRSCLQMVDRHLPSKHLSPTLILSLWCGVLRLVARCLLSSSIWSLPIVSGTLRSRAGANHRSHNYHPRVSGGEESYRWWSITTWSTRWHKLCPTINSDQLSTAAATQNYSCCCWYDRSVNENTQWYLHSSIFISHIHLTSLGHQIFDPYTKRKYKLEEDWPGCCCDRVKCWWQHRLSVSLLSLLQCLQCLQCCEYVQWPAVAGGVLRVDWVCVSEQQLSLEYGECVCVTQTTAVETTPAFTPHTASSSSWGQPWSWPCCRPCSSVCSNVDIGQNEWAGGE